MLGRSPLPSTLRNCISYQKGIKAMRTGWVVWCVLWAFFWITVGWLIFPVINLALFLFSIIAIFFAYVLPQERR
jgi:hypothetical protein